MNKIFGIGMGKTGTTSLAEALRILGFQGVDHPHPSQLQKFVSGDFKFGTDMPFSTRFKQMDKMFPDSKFILTVRLDDEQWIESVKYEHERYSALPQWILDYREEMYGITNFNTSNQFKVQTKHETDVLLHFADRPDDLLVMNIFEGDGWNELCSFLNVPIPSVPFPHLNKRVALSSK